jgi:hypothetical protein
LTDRAIGGHFKSDTDVVCPESGRAQDIYRDGQCRRDAGLRDRNADHDHGESSDMQRSAGRQRGLAAAGLLALTLAAGGLTACSSTPPDGALKKFAAGLPTGTFTGVDVQTWPAASR